MDFVQFQSSTFTKIERSKVDLKKIQNFEGNHSRRASVPLRMRPFQAQQRTGPIATFISISSIPSKTISSLAPFPNAAHAHSTSASDLKTVVAKDIKRTFNRREGPKKRVRVVLRALVGVALEKFYIYSRKCCIRNQQTS